MSDTNNQYNPNTQIRVTNGDENTVSKMININICQYNNAAITHIHDKNVTLNDQTLIFKT